MKKMFLVIIVCLVGMSSVWATGGSQGSQQAGASGREPYRIQIYTNASGTFLYILGVGIAEILNDQHPWLRATAIEGPGSQANELMMYEADDEMRRHSIYYGSADNAWRGTGAFAGKQNTRSKLGFCITLNLNGLVSNDPNITRAEDFVGLNCLVGCNVGTAEPVGTSYI